MELRSEPLVGFGGRARRSAGIVLSLLVCAAALGGAAAQDGKKPFEPYSGQPGKDVVWVPTPDRTVEAALDLAAVKPGDYVIDLGSGDGRMVIAAARRGARGHGVEFNPKMVELSNKLAKEAGVADRVKFVQGDMYAADLSRATALPLFLLTKNLDKLVPNFLKLSPGTRIVTVTYTISGWDHDEEAEVGPECRAWCRVYKYIVPANVAGVWKIDGKEFKVEQKYQKFAGSLGGVPVENGRLHGDEISFVADGVQYYGTVKGDEIRGQRPDAWRATRDGG